jgi:hypothetical protein
VAAAVELLETGHVGMVLGEPVGQDPDRLDPHLRGGGPQRGGDDLRVADHVAADVGLGDGGGVLGGQQRRRLGVPGRAVHDPCLEAQLT